MTVPTIVIGRFLMGTAAGVMNVVFAKTIDESCPEHLLGIFGVLDAYIGVSIMMATLLGLILPQTVEGEEMIYINEKG